jgi:hypothetical protein
MPARNPVTATIALLALPGANAFLSTCGDVKGDYRSSTCCGNPDKTLESLENFCPNLLLDGEQSLVIEQKEKEKGKIFYLPTKTILGAATYENGAMKSSAELDALMNASVTSSSFLGVAAAAALAKIKTVYGECVHLDEMGTKMDNEQLVAVRQQLLQGTHPSQAPDNTPMLPNDPAYPANNITVNVMTYGSAPPEAHDTVFAWGKLVELRINQTMETYKRDICRGIDGDTEETECDAMFPIMAHMCVMHKFFLAGECGPNNANCQSTSPALGPNVEFMKQHAGIFGSLGRIGMLAPEVPSVPTPLSPGTKGSVFLGGSIASAAASRNTAILFPSGFIYTAMVKKVYTCKPEKTGLVPSVSYSGPDPGNPKSMMMAMLLGTTPYFSKVPKLWTLQQVDNHATKLLKATKTGFFSSTVTSARDLQFVHYMSEYSLYARDCEFPESDALIWEPVSGAAMQEAQVNFANHPSYDETKVDINQPLDWLVRAETYTPASVDASTTPPTPIPASWTGAKLNDGFKELKMYGLLYEGKVKKILADADCAIVIVVGVAEPDSPSVPFPPSRDFANTGCDLPPGLDWTNAGRSTHGKYKKKVHSPYSFLWDKL